MPVSVIILLYATLPIAQAPASQTPPKANRRIFAPEHAALACQGAEPPARNVLPLDARLCDVAFVDPEHGWAVGDFGVIQHTDDGGRHWSPQVSGVTCTLQCVSFVDARRGWAAGGMTYPYLHDSSGVVLSTRDGGLTWQREPVLLPALRKIRFWSERQGWAIGCPSAMFPGGTFVTRDGGQSWLPASVGGTPRLRTGDFFDGRNAMLGGSLGLNATIGAGEFCRHPSANFVLQDVHDMRSVPPAYGWLAGDGGWIALTVNRGRDWQRPQGKLPPAADLFDFAALAVRGPKCWIAGSPGTRIFFTPDAGRTWSAFPTGNSLPLRAITFVDDLHGWATGEMGLILASSDGGQSWRRQRSGGSRTAVMAIAGTAGDLPLELLARTCKEQGFLGVAEVLGRSDADAAQRGDVPAADRLHEAMLHLGVSAGETACGFPVRQGELHLPQAVVAETWNRLYKGCGGEALLAHVVRQIRTWRPSVVLVPAARAADGLGLIVEHTVITAVKAAGDPEFLAGQFGAAGCEPWNVERVCLVSESREPGAIAMDADDWSLRLGQTWADAALTARGLIDERCRPGPAVASVQLLPGPASSASYSSRSAGMPENPPEFAPRTSSHPRLGGPAERVEILAGLASTDTSVRRPAGEIDTSFESPLDALAQRRQVRNLFERIEREPQEAFARLAKGEALPPGIDGSAAARLTFRLAQQFRHCGRWDLADKTLALLIRRYSEDPLAHWAQVERFQCLACSVTPQPPADEPEAIAPREAAPPQKAAGGAKKDASALPPTRAEQALALAREMESHRPDLFASPALRYPLAAVYSRLGQNAQAQRLYALDDRGTDRDAWWNCARGETWLTDRKGPPPKPLAACVAARQRPHLDGQLDEPLWKTASRLVLSSPAGDDRDWPAAVMFAHDEQYLYLAIQCRQAPGVRYEAAGERRPRDADLSQQDRVDIFLDPDRGYATYCQFTIDHRGWAADALCGERSWNPKWFVAAQTAGDIWTAEAAIPLAELHATILSGKAVWAIGVQRTVPGVGFQSWTTPASPAVVPEGFGWLEFQ